MEKDIVTDMLVSLFMKPITPTKFIKLLEEHALSPELALFHELRKRYMRKLPPTKAEVLAVKDVRKWWVANLSKKEMNKLHDAYMGPSTTIIINLSRNLPQGKQGPLYALMMGTARWHYISLLQKVLSEGACKVIEKRITDMPSEEIFLVRINRRETGHYGIAVKSIKEEEYLKELKRSTSQ